MSRKQISIQKKDSPTAEQKAAMDAHGKTIVSASAGSGKTFVMMEKICDIVEGENGDLSKLLAITFTRKAAAQMKEKLHDNLAKRLTAKNDTADVAHLQEQINKSASADVCTIHEFCSRLIKTYYYAADIDGIDSSFEIVNGDEGKSRAIQRRVIDDLFERRYKSGDEAFLNLVRCYGGVRADDGLKDIVFEAYKELRYLPGYSDILSECRKKCLDEKIFDCYADKYYREIWPIFNSLRERVLDFNPAEFTTATAKDKYGRLKDELAENLGKFVSSPDIFVELPESVRTVDLRGKPAAADKEKADEIKELTKQIEKAWKKYRLDVGDRVTELAKFRTAGKIAETLCDVIEEYDRDLLSARRRENILDYSDLELYALKILEDGEIRRHIHEKYRYVFVDEFQDINDVQSRIINCLSDDETETFFVGDTKQAIYGFRGSDSQIFNDTFDDFKERGMTEKGKGVHNALPLKDNFRSAKNIVNAVNDIFSLAMKEDICGTDYGGESSKYGVSHMMTYGGLYSENAPGRVEVDYFTRYGESDAKPIDGVYSVKGDFDSLRGSSSFSSHGRAIAAVIEQELGSEIYDLKSDKPRKVKPGDICILVRKGGKNADILKMVSYLRENGYPVSGIRSDDVLEQTEIQNLVNILKCIDNPEQDIPVCAFLLSPLCGLTENDLAEIRAYFDFSKGTFRGKIRRYEKTDSPNQILAQRLRDCRKKLNGYRKLSEIVGAATLIDRVCEDAGWTAVYEKDGGEVMKAVRLLQSRAYLGGSEMSVSEFLRVLDDGGFVIDAPDVAEADCIHVMTMHKAKGLEFPVVIIADVARQFTGNENEKIAFDKELGFVTKWYNPETLKYGDTIMQRAMKERKRKEEISNELNVFYVACTRAMYSLHIMNSCPKNFDEKSVMDARDYNSLVDFAALTGYNAPTEDTKTINTRYTFFDNKTTGRRLSYAVIGLDNVNDTSNGGDVSSDSISESDITGSGIDEELFVRMDESFEKEYRYRESIGLPVRNSVTRLRGTHKGAEIEMADDGSDAEENVVAEKSGRDKGTAYHKFLELCDFAIKDVKGIDAELSEIMPDEETKKLVSAENLSKILSMSAFENVPQKFYRERKFRCLLKACDVKKTDSKDEILVDGIIDFMAVERGRVRIVDYKYSEKDKKELVEEYYDQLKIYKMAVSKILGIPSENISTTLINIDRLEEIPLDIKF
ncbi:MAG: UvrD-helicase domain-containing protein [Clostridia bacterium]|nr:UvrD-helicase domain-containing protein [Clostridia bacterium]